MDCVYVAERPKLPAEYKIDWQKVTSVLQAQQEHEAYRASVRTREGKVAGYILEIEGRYFACSNDAAWLRDWQKQVQ